MARPIRADKKALGHRVQRGPFVSSVTIEVRLEHRDPIHDDQGAVKIAVPAVTDGREKRVDPLGIQVGMWLALDRGPAAVTPDRQDQGQGQKADYGHRCKRAAALAQSLSLDYYRFHFWLILLWWSVGAVFPIVRNNASMRRVAPLAPLKGGTLV